MTLAGLLHYLPRGNLLDDAAWSKRHKVLLWLLALHLPALLIFGLTLGYGLVTIILYVLTAPALCLLIGIWVPHRRVDSFFITAGLVYCSSALVGLTKGNIEAHFHFFIMIGFIALYQDWIPFLWNIVFTVISHGIGTAWQAGLIFNHLPAQTNPWLWSAIHGIAVLFACAGVVIFWRTTEDEQNKTLALTTQLADAELNQRKFTSELLVNLARRNQSMLYRQLDIINQLEEKERDPDALSELFRLDHLATRIRRNAESLLVLSGEEPTRVWSEPVLLIDVVRAAIAETEDLDRVAFAVDERMEVLGHTVTDLTHVLAELAENAVRFSPPEANVTIRTRPYLRIPGAAVLTVEDWGIGMRPEDIAAANDLLAHSREVDLSVSQRLGLHVVARLAARHNIHVSLTPTPGTGVTAVVVLPADLFAGNPQSLPPSKLAIVGSGPHTASPPRVVPMGAAAPMGPTGPMGPAGPMLSTAGPLSTTRPLSTTGLMGPGASSGPARPLGPTAPPTAPLGPTALLGPTRPLSSTNPASTNPASTDPALSNPAPTNPAPTGTLAPSTGIPLPQRIAHNDVRSNGNGTGNGSRGMHARPDQDHTPAWTGWWTPAELSTARPSPEEQTPAAAGVEPVKPESGPPPHPAPVTNAALPAAPDRPLNSSGPLIIERHADMAADSAPPHDPDSTIGTDSRLTHRVPQAHLAPELRRAAQSGEPVPEPGPPPDAERARDALSRFQASRQAAQQHVAAGQGDSYDCLRAES